jgi:hypothetical protein
MKERRLVDRSLSRRGFIKTAAAATGVTIFAPSLLSGCQVTSNSLASLPKADVMDEALEMMSQLATLGNHCPMAAEALMVLGHPEMVVPFVRSYQRRFRIGSPGALQPITNTNWKEALGHGERNADWINFFAIELKENEWTQVVSKWTDVLAAGLAAAAAHGLLRTAHAVRSLSVKRTELRIRELAEGLGYWAAFYQPLPETRISATAKLKPQQAIDRVPLLPGEKRARGSLMNQLKSLEGFQPFADSINLIDTAGKAEALLSEMTETFATAYLKNVSDRNNLSLLHAVTATAGLRSLLPYLSPATTQKVVSYGWQTAAALYSIAGVGSANANKITASPEIKTADLIERAVATKEEHNIKFTEACLREYALNPKQVYLQAATDSLSRLPSFASEV